MPMLSNSTALSVIRPHGGLITIPCLFGDDGSLVVEGNNILFHIVKEAGWAGWAG